MFSASRCGLKWEYGGLDSLLNVDADGPHSHTCHISPAGVDGGLHGCSKVYKWLTLFQTNQVNAARALGIPTESISGSTKSTERKRIEDDLKCGHPWTRLLYITPELLAMPPFRKVLTTIHQQGQLIRVAIDEAHCIRYAFKPSFYLSTTDSLANGAMTSGQHTKNSAGSKRPSYYPQSQLSH